MVGFISWLKGYVRIRVNGVSVERFMNLCGRRNILLWDVVRKDEYWEMCISVNGFRSLRPIVRKTGTRVVITERCGLPFFVQKMNKKKIFLAGCILSLFFWYASANFVWKIEIAGNYRITEEQLKDYLSEQKVVIGARKKNIDIEQLEKDIRMHFPDITWTSGKLDGTIFYLEIKENDGIKVQEVFSEEGAYDLVTDVDGEIYSIIVRSGIPKVKQGDTVTAGNVLVEGKVPIYNDDGTIREYILKKADADIYVKHTMDYEYSIPLKHIKKVYTGRENSYFFWRLGSKELSFHDTSPFCMFDMMKQETTPSLFKELRIPLSWGKFTYREYLDTECFYTKEEAKQLLQENLLQFLVGLEEKGVQIIEKDVTIKKNTNDYVIMGKIVVASPALHYVESAPETVDTTGSQ